jgi:NTE family protein
LVNAKSAFEIVLVMQGGGSLGAFECGVYKALERRGIKFDIISGTSIGAINAGIVAGAKGGEPAKTLEEFWLRIAQTVTPPVLPHELRSAAASMYSALWGNPHVFSPVWQFPFVTRVPYGAPYLYDLSPLEKTLGDYIDFEKLGPGHNPRLIVTSTDIQRSESVLFDSHRERITARHLVACAGYPFYGISWTKVNGHYLWDGSLMSNTPLREVINASPQNYKRVYMVNLFPKHQEKLPESLSDSWHRARDIIYSDRTDHNIQMSRVIKRYLKLLNEMHDLLTSVPLDDRMRERFMKMEMEYNKLTGQRGAIIEEVVKIERKEDVPFIFEDADFSIATVRELIRQGEAEAERALKDRS